MKVGSRVFLKEASFETTIIYQKYKNLGFPLACPCHLKSTDELEITDFLTKTLVLAKLIRNSQLTIAYTKDLIEK